MVFISASKFCRPFFPKVLTPAPTAQHNRTCFLNAFFFAVAFPAHLLISQLYQQLCWSHSVTKWGMNELNEQISLPLETAVNANSQHTEMSFLILVS